MASYLLSLGFLLLIAASGAAAFRIRLDNAPANLAKIGTPNIWRRILPPDLANAWAQKLRIRLDNAPANLAKLARQIFGEGFCRPDLANAWAQKLNVTTKILAWFRISGTDPNGDPDSSQRPNIWLGKQRLQSKQPLNVTTKILAWFRISDTDPNGDPDSSQRPNIWLGKQRLQSKQPLRTGNTTAIHIGNTKSCIAGYGGPHDPDTSYQLCIPSWVAFTDNGTLFGQAALKHAAVSPGTAVSGFKRVMGLGIHNAVVKREMELVPYNLVRSEVGSCAIEIKAEGGDARDFSAEEVAGILMSRLKQMAEAHLGREITEALVTAPMHFGDHQRHSLMAHARWDGGFSATISVGEYAAAAAAYGLHEKARHGKVILVFHMGGRTTHATRFKFKNGMALFLGKHYDPHLGGADLTGRVVDYFVELIKEKHHRDIRQDESALRKLRTACEHAKKALSHREDTLVKVELESLLDGAVFFEPLTRAKFEELNRDLLERATAMVEQAVTWDAPPDQWERLKDRVDEIILVGGSVRIPKIAQFFRDYFHGREPIVEEEAVIRGAAHLSRPEGVVFPVYCDEYYKRNPVSYYGC